MERSLKAGTKAKLRHLNHPVPDAVLEAALHLVVAETWFGQVYRADGARECSCKPHQRASSISMPSEVFPGMS